PFAMKTVTYSKSLQEIPELYAKVRKATELLEEIIGSSFSGDRIDAEWDRSIDERGHSVLTLRIADWMGAKTAVVAPPELDQLDVLRSRFYRLWGGLLSDRNDKSAKTVGDCCGGLTWPEKPTEKRSM